MLWGGRGGDRGILGERETEGDRGREGERDRDRGRGRGGRERQRGGRMVCVLWCVCVDGIEGVIHTILPVP
jgi:hypothetical protein